MSKNFASESPYTVTGSINPIGSEKLPKGICKDKTIGTWKANNMKDLNPMKWLQGKVFRL